MDGLIDYKCPACGGAIEFDAATQRMKCPYCDTEIDVEELLKLDADIADSKQDDIKWDEGRMSEWQEGEADDICAYICNSCGGEVVADKNTAASTCPFCGNRIVMKGNIAGDLKPDLIIPFKLDKNTAKEAYRRHISKKRLLPKLFKTENHIDELKGIYVPFWLFDADTQSNARYKGTKIRSWSDGNYNYTETSFYAIRRAANISFGAVTVDGSSKMEDTLMESIEPYNVSEGVEFRTAYLAGYIADRYDVEANQCVIRANERIKNSVESILKSTVSGYSTLSTEHCNVAIQNGVARYALYPVWLMNTTWKGKQYTFAMNGQTGKMVGDLPMDVGAFWAWFGGLTVGIGAVVYGIAQLLTLI